MSIITLTTDLGIVDYYVASLKGAILKASPSTAVVDITHLNKPFDIREAAYHIRGVLGDFPADTIHIIGVNSEPVIDRIVPEKSRYPSILRFRNQYVVATNNGVFDLILNGEPHDGFWMITDFPSNPEKILDVTKSIFVKAACQLANGEKIDSIATPATNLVKSIMQQPIIKNNYEVVGAVLYIDYYGNVITNITQEHFDLYGKNTPFELTITHHSKHKINKLSTSYYDMIEGESGAFINSMGYLEIAVKNGANNGGGGGANRLFGLDYMSQILLELMPPGSRNGFE
jgi:hypothetical protein